MDAVTLVPLGPGAGKGKGKGKGKGLCITYFFLLHLLLSPFSQTGVRNHAPGSDGAGHP